MSSTQPTTSSTAINQMMIHSMRTLQAQHDAAQHTAHGRGCELQERINSNHPDDGPFDAHTDGTARHSTAQHSTQNSTGRGCEWECTATMTATICMLAAGADGESLVHEGHAQQMNATEYYIMLVCNEP